MSPDDLEPHEVTDVISGGSTADLFFVSALRAGADCTHTRLRPLADHKEPLAPHERFAQRMLLALQALGHIEPELSPSWAEDWLHSRDWLTRGFDNVSWRIIRPSGDAKATVSSWLDGSAMVESGLESWVAVWEDLALAEVAAYAQWALADSGFNPAWANDAGDALKEGVAKFSIEKATYLIHIALRSLALAQQRGGASSRRPGQAFAASLGSYVRRAHSEKWAIRGMSRPPELPRSAVVALFAEVVTGLKERYYSDRPCLDALLQVASCTQTSHRISMTTSGSEW